MQKIIFAVVVLALLVGGFLLFKKSATPPVPEPPPATPSVTEKTITEDTDLYIINAKYPQFGIASIDAQIEKMVQDAVTQFKKDAADAAGVPTAATYEFDSIFEDPYIGDDIVSVRLTISTYMGGAHPLSVMHGLNFRRADGVQLSESDALQMTGLSLQQIAAESLKQMKAKHGEALFAEGLDPTPENYQTFVVTKDSVTFVFQLYQIAAYAAGFQEVTFVRKK